MDVTGGCAQLVRVRQGAVERTLAETQRCAGVRRYRHRRRHPSPAASPPPLFFTLHHSAGRFLFGSCIHPPRSADQVDTPANNRTCGQKTLQATIARTPAPPKYIELSSEFLLFLSMALCTFPPIVFVLFWFHFITFAND